MNGEAQRALCRPIDDNEFLDFTRQQTADHSPRRAAGAEHDRNVGGRAPIRRLLVEIGEKAGDIGIVAPERAAFPPQRVHRAQSGSGVCQLVAGRVGGFLVRHGDVCADQPILAYSRCKFGEGARRNGFALV